MFFSGSRRGRRKAGGRIGCIYRYFRERVGVLFAVIEVAEAAELVSFYREVIFLKVFGIYLSFVRG